MSEWAAPSASPAHISRLPYLRGLDGVRALAVVIVMLYHADQEWMHGGFLGVEVFFVISGYLITLLLIAEHERSGRVSVKQFWLRRARRLLPALIVLLGLLAIYLVVFYARAKGRVRGDMIAGLTYGTNWYQIWVGAGYTDFEAFAPLRHLWSLAVEEQFYVVWPVIMMVILRFGRDRLPRVALWLFAAALAIALAVALLYVPGDVAAQCSPDSMHGYTKVFGRCISINDTLYLSTFSRAGGVLLGAAFAMIWRPLALLRGPMRRKWPVLDLLALIGLVALGYQAWNLHLSDPAVDMLAGSRFDPALFRGGFLFTGLATLLVLGAVTHQRTICGRLLGNPVLNWIGTRSYGLYLFHWPVYQVIRQQAGTPLTPAQFALAMAVTLPITELSYRIVERPIREGRIGEWLRSEHRRPNRAVLRRRRWIAGSGVVATAIIGFAGVSVAMAPNECLGDVECSVAEASAVRPSPPPTAPVVVTISSTVAPATTTTTTPASTDPAAPGSAAPSSTAATEPTPSPTAPPTGAPPTTATAATVPPLRPRDPHNPIDQRPAVALGESVMLGAVDQLAAGGFLVDATKGIQGTTMLEKVRAMKEAGTIGRVVVIHAGTNGPISAETYAAMAEALPPDDVWQVVFLTVRAPGKSYVASNNRLINDLARYPNVTVADWASESQAIRICSDGVHVACSTSMRQFYANVVFRAIGRPDLVLSG